MMDTLRDRLGRIFLVVGAVSSTGCVVDGIPACPGRCFEFTLVEADPRRCVDIDGGGGQLPISFTDVAQTGYRGRHCFNSASLPNVIVAIEHLDAGGQLSELSEAVRVDYVATVDAVVGDIEAECLVAAPGQCDDAAEVCSGIAADAYQQLVIDQACTLEDGGVESVTLGGPMDRAARPSSTPSMCSDLRAAARPYAARSYRRIERMSGRMDRGPMGTRGRAQASGYSLRISSPSRRSSTEV